MQYISRKDFIWVYLFWAFVPQCDKPQLLLIGLVMPQYAVNAIAMQLKLSPSPHQTHAKCTSKDQKAGNNPLSSPKHAPALVAEKVFGQQLDQ